MLALIEFARGRAELAAERFSEAFDHLARIHDPGDIAHHPFSGGWGLANIADADAESFADWMAGVLRREGMTMEPQRSSSAYR